MVDTELYMELIQSLNNFHIILEERVLIITIHWLMKISSI